MVSSILSAELAATCSALGYSDGNKYYIDKYCRETVKDLIRYLRHDDENHEIRRHLGEAKILVTDLLPIIKHYHEDSDLFDVVLRLLVNLTNPALLLYREELPAEKTSRNYYLQIISQLQGYKEAFTDQSLWSVMSQHLSDILKIDSEERPEEQGMVLERILVLIRNVLQVPANPESEHRPDNDASVHDQVLWALHESGLMDLILYMTSSGNEQAYYLHNLEIISLILRDQVASELASTAMERSIEEKERDATELVEIRQQEVQQRTSKTRQYVGARHSRFGGTFVLNNFKSISDKDLILHKQVTKVDNITHSEKKKKLRKPKNKVVMQGDELKRRSAFSVRLFLKEFCVEFLSGSYNRLMHYVKDCLVRNISQPNDESFYLWSVRFFMEFNRIYNLQVQYVSETMNVQVFHWIQSQMEHCQGMMLTDKKKLRIWSKRLHLALRAYQELLMYLTAMENTSDPVITKSAQVIQGNLFYLVEYRELVIFLLLGYDEVKMSRNYLKDLMETVHVFMKLMERFCKKQRGIVVQKKTKTVKRKKTKKSAPVANPAPSKSTQEIWDEVSPQLPVVLSNGVIPDDIIPFDAASDKSIDDQKVDAMRRVHTLLKNYKFEEAVGLLRAAREVWPENDSFGSSNMSPEEEFAAIREIFFADIAEDPEVARAAQAEREQHESEEDEDSDVEHDDEEEEEGSVSYAEQELQFPDFVKRLVNPKAVLAASHLLQQFEKNSTFTNHCLAKMLHRIAFDAKAPGMLFQASLFRTFQRILTSKRPQHQELAKLAQYVVKMFSKVAATNTLVFVELLFWKNAREAIELEEGYGSYKAESAASKKAWKEEEEDELRLLFQEHKESESNEDVVTWIMERLINRNRSKQGVTKKLRELYLLAPTRSKAPKNWGEEEVEQLKELYDQYKDSGDVLGNIMSNLTVPRPKVRVIDKLLDLNLVSDRKELHKSKSRKKAGNLRSGRDDYESENEVVASDSDMSSDDGGPSSPRAKPKKQTVKKRKGSESVQDRSDRIKARYSQLQRAPTAQLAAILLQVTEAGLPGGLKWIKESLEEAAEEEDQEVEGVPLLPLDQDSLDAMDNPLFQRMLHVLGMSAPYDEQEAYWRIPGILKPDELRQRAATIQEALDGTLTLPDATALQSSRQVSDDSSSEDEFVALRKFTSNTQKDNDGDSNNESMGGGSNQDEVPTVSDAVKTTSQRSKNSQVRRKRTIVLQSDSEDESPSLAPDVDDEDTQTNNMGRGRTASQLESDEDIPMDTLDSFSHSENDNNSSHQRRRIVIESDSDSDSQSVGGKTNTYSRKDCPLKESSLLNSQKKTEKDSSEEPVQELNESEFSGGKGTKRMLSSSEGSEEESNSSSYKKKLSNIRV